MTSPEKPMRSPTNSNNGRPPQPDSADDRFEDDHSELPQPESYPPLVEEDD